MYIAVRSNSRTASAARRSLGEALTVALRGGAVSGFLVVALGLLGVLIMYWVVYPLVQSTLAGRGRNAILDRRLRLRRLLRRALFAQLGGGIYTKAADVGADLVGKVEAGIPRTTPVTRRSSPTSSATTSVTAPVVAPTSSSRPSPRSSAP